MDRNAPNAILAHNGVASLSARRAWIEMLNCPVVYTIRTVALRKESVDRNKNNPVPALPVYAVALRKESVDRNVQICSKTFKNVYVALRKESVDRNQGVHYDNYNLHCVALRKESVDRNSAYVNVSQRQFCRSPQGERG